MQLMNDNIIEDVIQQVTLQEEIDQVNIEWEAEYGEIYE